MLATSRSHCCYTLLSFFIVLNRTSFAWESTSTTSPLLWSSSLIEFTNSSGGSVHCQFPGVVSSDEHAAVSQQQQQQLTWLDANRQPVQTIPGIRQVMSNGTIFFPPYRGDAHRKDVHSTEYRCLVSTTSSGTLLSPPISVRSVVIGALQVYATDSIRTIEGGTAVLVCLILPSDQRWAAEVTHWTAGQHRLLDSHQPAGGKYAVIEGNLHVSQVTPEDARLTYRCSVRHRLTEESSISPPARILLVNNKDVIISSRNNIVPSSNAVVQLHAQLSQQQSVFIWCNIPSATKIRWFKVLGTGSLTEPINGDGRRIVAGGDWLQLRQVNVEDAGRYRCQAGEQQLDFQLNVHGQLSAVLEPARQVAQVNQPVELTCNTSSPNSLIRWTRNGLDIPFLDESSPSGRYVLLQPHVLRINQAQPTDSGSYQCFIHQLGSMTEIQASAELVVRDSTARLTNIFNEQTVHLGRSVYLHCFAAASPAPSVVWSVDSSVVPYTSGRVSVWSHQMDDSGVRSYLNISSTEVEDGGLYCCSVQSSPVVQHCARLNVFGPASVRWAANKTAIAGQDYFLNCPYSGFPIMSITWYRHNQVLKDSNSKYKLFINGTLRISAIDPSMDAGEYTCQVRGTASSIADRALYIDIIRAPVIEPFSFPTLVRDGGRAQVTCSISAGDLPIQIGWLKDGRPVPNRLNIETQSGEFHSLLIFKRLRGEHSGVYTCTARNLALSPASHSASLLVQVPPKWVVEPQDVGLLEHEAAKILCGAHGIPAPTISWFRVEGEIHHPIQSSSKISLKRDGSLVYTSVSKSDEGSLICRASNNIGAALTKTIRVSVNAAAKVRIKAGGSMILPTGSEVFLSCQVSGDPPLTVHWKKSDQLIMEENHQDRYHLSSRSSTLDLNVSKAESGDSGVYVCIAANAYGSDATEIRLIIQELPKAPIQLQLTSIQSRSAELEWLDDHSDVQYRIQLSRPQPSNWSFNYSVESGRSVVTLPHLQPFTVYQVVINAINSAGIGPSSAPLEFQTLEEAPSGTPRHVLAEPKSSRSLLVTWLPPNEETWNGPIVTFTITCTNKGNNNINQLIQRSIPFWPNSNNNNLQTRRVQIVIEELHPATLYSITVRSLNRMGSGPESDPVTVMTPEASPSSAPVGVNCAAMSPDAIQVSWAHLAPAETHGHLQGFRIFYKMIRSSSSSSSAALLEDVEGNPSFRMESKRVGNTVDTVLYGLQSFQNYSIRISAINRVGNGPLSSAVICQTDENVAGIVQDIKVLSISGTVLKAIWRRPVPSNGRITHYVLHVKDTTTNSLTKFVQHDPENMTYTIGKLVENRLYEITIVTGSRVGESRPSRIVTVAPMSKSGVKVVEFSRHLYVEESSQVTLKCPAAGALPIDKSWTFGGQSIDTKDGSSLHISKVSRNDEGEFSCTARNAYGRDSIVYTLHLLRAPEAPQLSVTPTSTSSIRLSWTKPLSRPVVLDYTIFYRPIGASNGSATLSEKMVDGSEDGTILEELLCGTQYELQIQARNQIGFGPKSPILRAMTRGAGPTVPSDLGDLIGFTSSLPGTVYLHLDRWPTAGCRIIYLQIEKRGPMSLISMDGEGSWNALASNLNADQQPMLKISDFLLDEVYQLRLTASSDAGIQTVSYSIRRIHRKNVETGSFFEVVPLTASTALNNNHHGLGSSPQSVSYESAIVIGSMSISGVMLLFSLAAISYVIRKRKQYRTASLASSSKAAALPPASSLSLRTVTEHLDHQQQQPNHFSSRSLPRISNNVGSTYSLRKPDSSHHIDYDDDDITPYATFTLKPICGMDTSRSLAACPSPNSISEGDYGHHQLQHHQGATLPQHYSQTQREHLNRSPVPPYRPPTASDSSDTYSNTSSTAVELKKRMLIQQLQQHHHYRSNQRTMAEVLRPAPNLSEFHHPANKFRF